MSVWSICRVDKNLYTEKVSLFEVQAASRKADLDMAQAKRSGFVGPDDQLVIVGPTGRILTE